jgi:thymidine kinase
MLHIILGCMFAGKTESIIRIARKYRAIEKKVLIVNHKLDARYSGGSVVESHNGTMEECIKVDKLIGLDYKEYDVVIIEESQFFPDILEFFETIGFDLVLKNFIVSGLVADYNMKPIGDIISLIPMADTVEKINGFCQECKDGTIGPFTRRINSTTNVILIGGRDKYECVCRLHYLHR